MIICGIHREENQVSSKLFWDAIEYIIINKHSICCLPKNFAHFAIFIEISAKDKVYEALKKYDKLNLLIDNSNKLDLCQVFRHIFMDKLLIRI